MPWLLCVAGYLFFSNSLRSASTFPSNNVAFYIGVKLSDSWKMKTNQNMTRQWYLLTTNNCCLDMWTDAVSWTIHIGQQVRFKDSRKKSNSTFHGKLILTELLRLSMPMLSSWRMTLFLLSPSFALYFAHFITNSLHLIHSNGSRQVDVSITTMSSFCDRNKSLVVRCPCVVFTFTLPATCWHIIAHRRSELHIYDSSDSVHRSSRHSANQFAVPCIYTILHIHTYPYSIYRYRCTIVFFSLP